MRNFNLHSRTENVFTKKQLRGAILRAFRAIGLPGLEVAAKSSFVETELKLVDVRIIARCVKVGSNDYCVSIRYKIGDAVLAVAFLNTSDL